MKFFTINLLYALVLMCGSIIFGGIIAYGSATLNVLSIEFDLSTFEYASFQSIPALISIVGPFLFNFLLSRMRRKIVTSITGCAGCAFWLALLSMNKKYFWLAILIRGFHGLILSGVSLICPLYIIELSPEDSKGFFGSLHPIAIALAHVIYNFLGVFHKWQYPIYLSAAFMLIFGTCVWFIPDSPSDPKKKNPDNTEPISNDLKESIFDKKYRRDFIVSMILMFSVQFSGNTAIMQNCSPLLSEVGLDFDSGYQASMVVSAQLITCCISSLLIDKFGGKSLWVFSSSGTTLTLLLYALNVKFQWSKWIPMIVLFGYQLSFGLGLANIPFYYISIIFPPDIKQMAMAIGMSLSWVGATIVMFLVPYLESWIGQFGLMIILCGINLFCALFGLFFIKEKRVSVPVIEDTTGRLDSIQDNLMDNQGDIANL